MGGKGQRRRNKNFWSSHGGEKRLPPPPKAKELDAVPSKLRRIMELQNGPPPTTATTTITTTRQPGVSKKGKGAEKGSGPDENKQDQKVVHASDLSDSEIKVESKDNDVKDEMHEKGKRKKRKTYDDLQFQKLVLGTDQLTKRKRKKEYLDARKKKNKKVKVDDSVDFPGHENIKFGEVVVAPPKLTVPKALKKARDASQERLRLLAVEAYRNRKGWTSRPGLHLPLISETPT